MSSVFPPRRRTRNPIVSPDGLVLVYATRSAAASRRRGLAYAHRFFELCPDLFSPAVVFRKRLHARHPILVTVSRIPNGGRRFRTIYDLRRRRTFSLFTGQSANADYYYRSSSAITIRRPRLVAVAPSARVPTGYFRRGVFSNARVLLIPAGSSHHARNGQTVRFRRRRMTFHMVAVSNGYCVDFEEPKFRLRFSREMTKKPLYRTYIARIKVLNSLRKSPKNYMYIYIERVAHLYQKPKSYKRVII